MTHPILIPALCAFAWLLCVGDAQVQAQARSPIAEVICEPTGDMHRKLKQQFGGRQAASGLRGREQIMEVWTDRSGDWTLVVTYASGTSCIVAMGEDWASFDPHDPA